MRALIGSLVLATALFAGGCGGAQTDAPKAEQGASPAALTIAERTVPDFRMVSAVLTNRDVGDARARIGGRITQILVKEGEKVRAGQVVADHTRSWATAATITDPAHRETARLLRADLADRRRTQATRSHSDGHVVAIRPLPDYDALYGVDFDPGPPRTNPITKERR